MHQLVIRDLEIHNRADLRQVLHSLIGVHGGTTCGDNAVLRIDLAENLVLDLDETLRAACIDNLLQRLVALVLDDDVASMKSFVMIFANTMPSVDLPEPGMPIRTTLFFSAMVSPP